ncbi:MAG: hypothetical protein BM556_09895 [Bacteriovorax sp. MedPE-SWde]|nr:MAG: hypothetical protein BM556_09895 [Bacteriovorax sp. MedPE-SWde]
MKKLALLTLVLMSFTNAFAMSESKTKCEDANQVSAYQEQIKDVNVQSEGQEVKSGSKERG